MFPGLPSLPDLGNFAPTAPGSGGGFGTGINLPSLGDVLGGLGGVIQNPGGAITSGAGKILGIPDSIMNAGAGFDLLRIIIIILGIVCIIGAIYLYKPSVIEAPIKAAQTAATTAAVAA